LGTGSEGTIHIGGFLQTDCNDSKE
jgi:hypothetical protein